MLSGLLAACGSGGGGEAKKETFPYQGKLTIDATYTCVDPGDMTLEDMEIVIDANGKISGGDSTAPISGSVSSSGNISIKLKDTDSTLETFDGKITRSGDSLNASGTAVVNGNPITCNGTWAGTGKATNNITPDNPNTQKSNYRLNTFPAGTTTDAVASFQNNNGDEIYYWGDTDLTTGKKYMTQSLMVSKNGKKVRTLYNQQQEPIRIINEDSGFFLILEWESDHVLIKRYNNEGRYIDGFAVMETGDGKISIAPIVGLPVLSGQVIGTVNSGNPGAFSVTPTSKGAVLGTFSPLPESLQSVFQDTTFKTVASKEAADLFQATVDALTEFYSNSSVLGWAADNRPKLMLGAVLGGACAGLVPGCQIVGLGTAGFSVSMLVASWTTYEGGRRLMDEVRNDAGLDPLPDDTPAGVNRLNGLLANAWINAKDLSTTLIDAVNNIMSSGSNSLSDLPDQMTQSTQFSTPAQQQYISPASLTTPSDIPYVAPTPVQGVYFANNGENYTLTGQVNTNGDLNVTGSNPQNNITVNIDGTLSNGNITNGSYKDSFNRTGTVSGGIQNLGTCQTQQQSGGQGSFTFAFYMGPDAGSVSFSYDAYYIPDRFEVAQVLNGNKVILFSTNGLVSNGTTTSFTVDKESTIYVGVSAPNNGTAWEVTLGCPQ